MIAMDHPRIDDDLVAERYVMDGLSATEKAAFEEHFFECAPCLETLEHVRRFREDLRSIADEVRPAPRKAFSRWRTPSAALLAASWLAAVGAAAYFFLQEREIRRELAATRMDSAEALRREQSVRTPPVPAMAPALPLAASVFVLDRTRGGEAGAPDNRLSLRASGPWIVLLADLPEGTTASECRVRVTTAGRPVAPPLTASATPEGMLAVSLPASLLAPGDYTVTVEGRDGATPPLATYRFRLLP